MLPLGVKSEGKMMIAHLRFDPALPLLLQQDQRELLG